MAESVLKVRNLTTKLQIKGKPYKVVEDLSFDLHRGKTLALVGESGCGKTMTAFSIMRVLPEPPALPSEGEVIYQGQNLLKLDETQMRKIRGARIAMIFQNPMTALNPVYTIGSQLMEVAELHLGLYGEEAFERAAAALKDVKISSPEECLYGYPHQLSGGMRQRVMIAMALMCEPDILIADEPTTALDVTIQAQVLDLMRELQNRKGMAVLLITHDMGVVAEMAHDVIVMYAAQAVERGSVEDIFDNMAHPYTQGLFNSRPHLQTHQKTLYSIQGSVPPITNFPSGCRFHPRCPFVTERAKQGKVPLIELKGGDNPHQVLCWLHEDKGKQVN